jgi:hypothetical protein
VLTFKRLRGINIPFLFEKMIKSWPGIREWLKKLFMCYYEGHLHLQKKRYAKRLAKYERMEKQ